ncbi:MAG: site-specific integrase [Acidobacteriia bacterium]|nr:site-specific integrase [Terriglobia bacterium]
MRHAHSTLQEIFETRIQTLALTLHPTTVRDYRFVTRDFLRYLHTAFPHLRRLSQLRRDPHLLGWLRWLGEHLPPLANKTRISRLIMIRRLLEDLAADGHPVEPDLIRAEDFPPLPRYLPRPLSPQDDQLLQQELRRTDDLHANALLLTRATGIRIGECVNLALDCLRPLGSDQWALHVPIGKVYTERLVPADPDVRRWVERILALRAQAPSTHLANSEGFLLPRNAGRHSLHQPLRRALAEAGQRAGCSCHVTPHRLRHSFATEMLRLGVSLPALMQLLGHHDIRMTLRYLEVTQPDLQREFHLARQNVARLHQVPTIAVPTKTAAADLPGIRQAIAATRHLLEQFRRRLADEKTRRKLQRLDKRLLTIASQLDDIPTPEK